MLRIDGIDKAMASYLEWDSTQSRPLVLDLSRVRWFDAGCLAYLGGVIAKRHSRSKITYLQLPKNDSLNYLKSWRFAEFMTVVSGVPFEDLLVAESRVIWSKIGISRYDRSVVGVEDSLPPHEALYLTPINDISRVADFDNLPQQVRKARSIASIELNKWQEDYLYDRLDDFLSTGKIGDSQGHLVGTHILDEAVLNACLHPAATLAYYYGGFNPPYSSAEARDSGARGFFELSVWDNGRAAPSVLMDALKGAASPTSAIMNAAAGGVAEDFEISYDPSRPGEVSMISIRNSQDVTGLLDSEVRLALAMFLPGVTSQPGRPAATSARSSLAQDRLGDMSGLSGTGLYRARVAAIDSLGGRVEYYSEQIHLRIERSLDTNGNPKTWTYRVHLHYGRDIYWPMQGNLIVFRLPQRAANV